MTTLQLLKQPQAPSADTTIQVFFRSDHCASLGKNTIDLYANALKKNFLPFCLLNHVDVSKAHLVQASMPAYVAFLEQKGLGGTTIQQYVSIVRIMMKAMGEPIKFTYRRKSADRKAHQIKQMERWFDEDDIAKCLAHQTPCTRDRLIIRLLAETGARVQELANVTWADVDLENRTVWLRWSKTQPRPSFFSDETAELFRRLKPSSMFKIADTRKVFPSTSRVKGIVTDILDDLGLKTAKDGRGCHTFRHWVATYLYYTGDMRLTDIAVLLGDQADTIRSTYLHPTPAMLRKRVVQAMGWEGK